MNACSNYLTPDDSPDKVTAKDPDKNEQGDIFPPTCGEVTILIDGERAFGQMHEKVSALKAGSSLYICIWYIHLDTILKDSKGKNPIKFSKLIKNAADQGVTVRILISYLEFQKLPLKGGKKLDLGFGSATPARKLAAELNKLSPNIKSLVSVHPYKLSFRGKTFRPGTFHEKLIIVDKRYVFCGGLEFVRAYSNSDPTHQKPNADKSSKIKKSNRHDVHSMIEGPVVKHFEQHFITRWREARSNSDPDLPEVGKDVYQPDKCKHAVQVVITKSVDASPNFQTVNQSVYDSYLCAVKSATRYIYIENQYFREKGLTDAITDQLAKESGLQVIIVIPEKAEEAPNPLTLHADFVQRTMIEQLKNSPHANRVGVFSLRTTPKKNEDIYVHAKIMIIDDKWLTIGTANANPRSFFLDNEINIVARNDELAKKFREELWQEHMQLKTSLPPTLALSNSKDFVHLWQQIAEIKKRKLKAGEDLDARIIPHKTAKGQKIDLDKLGLKKWEKFFLPDPDRFVGNFPSVPIA